MKRRTYLQTAGAALGSGLVPTTVSASGRGDVHKNDKGKTLYERSLHLRDTHDWSVSEWRSFLDEHGAQFNFTDKVIPLATLEGDDQLSAQYLNKGYLKLSVTFNIGYHYPSDYLPRIDVDWEFNITGDLPNYRGEDPWDAIELRWDSEDYNLADSKQYYGYNVRDPADHGVVSKTNEGMIAEWDDYGETATLDPLELPVTVGSYFGTAVRHESTEPADHRGIEVHYKHFWSNVELTWSFTAGAPSVTPQNVDYSWVADLTTVESEIQDSTKTKEF